MPTARAIGPTSPMASVIFARELADALGAAQPDVVLGQQLFVLVEFAGELVEERAGRFLEAARQIFAQAADPQVTREHAEAGEHLVQIEQLLALAEAVHHHGDRADLHAVRAEPDEMAAETLQLGDQHPDLGDAVRHVGFDAEQALDRQAERQTVRLRAEVVHPLDQRNDLLPLLLLGGLLDARVQESDRRIERDDLSRRRAPAPAAARRACWGAVAPC